nr:cell surface protein SprA [Candidatus Krumholzibacteria bacterium]
MSHPALSRITVLTVLLVLLGSLVPAPEAHADPNYEGLLLYSLDPVISTTEDPRLLGVERLIMRERLLAVGIDPVRDKGRQPNLYDQIYRHWRKKSGYDLDRKEQLVEYNGATGLMTVFEYPKFFFLFPAPETLPGGMTFYPPRPVSDPVVRLFVDEVDRGARRRHLVRHVMVRDESLDIAGAGRSGQNNEGLINLTIPIKLPRTLEKIIGRGEKTKIKISGRERIAISGESTVVNPFVPTERVSSQSLFPSLDMEQELQVNLSGTIGEKIIIEVDHNSAAIGPEATKIKLMYQGLEDEIIRTIETGDVGLTLPGSQLLGYSSNKSGLFGIKVTGQVGRAEFTAVASKQKAEASAKTFNSKGGQVEDFIIYSYQYLNNRFFKLDLPAGSDPNFMDSPGRNPAQEVIDTGSIKIYRLMGVGPLGDMDIRNVAVYLDSTGTFWNAAGSPEPDWSSDYEHGVRWREIDNFDLLLDSEGDLVAVDMNSQMAAEDYLAVIYNVVDRTTREVLYQVGDRPGTDDGDRVSLPDESELYYRMKLLKAPSNKKEPISFRYVLRNIYSLGGAGIDETTFDFRIERDDSSLQPDQDLGSNIPYIQIFGLDQTDPQLTGGPDGIVDWNDPLLFDLQKGILKFPTFEFPTPFAADQAQYEAYADDPNFDWGSSYLSEDGTLTPELYDPDVLPTQYPQFGKFRLVASHASAASSFNLGVSNIEEGSESVTLDGRTLQKGVDYEIDYTFGQIELKGDAANLNADSKISVNYSYAPFFGGGSSSLLGMNLGYDLGRDSKLSTTWLYQSEDIVGEKAKLGEEPSKTLVGNISLSHTFRPYVLTHVANFLSRVNTERESSLQFSGEMALSLPNPNTKGRVFLEDFEGVDASDIISLTRTGWSWSSTPFLGEDYTFANPDDMRSFDHEDRVDTRWFLPRERVERRMLNPDLVNQERGETQQVMDLYMKDDDGWDAESWGGIMRGVSRTGRDLSKSQFVEIWINDGEPELLNRRGRVHIDFGYISEDGFWPLDDDGNFILNQLEQEDGILPGEEADGVWSYLEDVGLDGEGENGPQRYSAEYDADGDAPFPYINGTARNSREDTEDINGNGRLDRDNGYFTATIDLRETEALVDVVYDYDDVQDLVNANMAWRKYRIRLGDIDRFSSTSSPNIEAITHVRVWYEDPEPGAPESKRLQLSEFKFLGSRWEREGVRRVDGEVLLSEGERLPGEEFFLGEVNNKENPDYFPPFTVNEVNNIPEKEQSMVVDFRNLDEGHMVRASKQVSPRGDDYTGYREMSWYWYNPSHQTADVDLFFRVGSDTLNYYEVGYRFNESDVKTGWKYMNFEIPELTNVKNNEVDAQGVIHGEVHDLRTGQPYRVRVVGRPDLRKVRRYYFVVANNELSTDVSGYFYINDVKLEGVKKDTGLAQRAGVRLNMADVINMDMDWSRRDAEYHGLDQRVGTGINNEDWSFSTSFNVEDFIPLLGFKLPVTGSRRQTLNRPKYQTNSDVEIIDENVRNRLSTIDTQERFSTRLSHTPSQSAIPRYLIDPFTILLNGSQNQINGPLQDRYKKNLQGSLNYDLRISGDYRLGRYPLLKYIPIVSGLSIVPRKIAFGASFTSTYDASTTFNDLGEPTRSTTVVQRPGKLTASLDYKPLSVLDLTASGGSDRDLLREKRQLGLNIGEEEKRNYDVRMTITPPLAKELPGGPVFYPFRAMARGLAKVRPSIQFQGQFADDHRPAIAQEGDPPGVRNVSNNNSWEFRLNVPVGDAFTKLLPEKKYSDRDRQRLIDEQKRLEQQKLRTGQAQDQDQTDANLEDLTPEERQQREEERLLREAEQRLDEERDRGMGSEPTEAKGEPILSLARLYNVGLNPIRNITPVKVTYSDRRASSYNRMQTMPSFWYQTGLANTASVADSLYVSSSFQERQVLDLSTTSKLAKNLSLDMKFSNSVSLKEQVSSRSKSYQQDWPDASINLTGIEKWGLLGGSSDPNSGWFRSSTFNFSYKRSKTVNNMTSISYNPAVNTAINPRLTFNFHSGMSATLTATISKDDALNNGILTETRRNRYSMQLRHQFRAQKMLARLGLYRPGSNPTINMDVDVTYQNDKTQRFNPGSSSSTPTGTKRWSTNPRFSYQVSRNLSGALRFIFSYNKNLATNQSTTSLGLGLEATFVF